MTAFNASVLTDTPETTEKCLGAIANVMSDRGMGAQLLGAHLEGPFLAKEYKGAMPEALLREGDEKLLRAYQNRFPGVIRYITVSPEVPGVVDMIGKISQDVTVAIGHSGADYDTSMEAIRRGARCVTHTFNAMRLFHQHQPAIMGAALESDCWCEAICDGRHLHPGTVRMLLKCQGLGSGHRHHGQHHGGGSAGRQLQARRERRGRPGRGRGARLITAFARAAR